MSMLRHQLFVDKAGYLLTGSGSRGTLIILSDEFKDAFGPNDRIEVKLINGVFKPV